MGFSESIIRPTSEINAQDGLVGHGWCIDNDHNHYGNDEYISNKINLMRHIDESN